MNTLIFYFLNIFTAIIKTKNQLLVTKLNRKIIYAIYCMFYFMVTQIIYLFYCFSYNYTFILFVTYIVLQININRIYFDISLKKTSIYFAFFFK